MIKEVTCSVVAVVMLLSACSSPEQPLCSQARGDVFGSATIISGGRLGVPGVVVDVEPSSTDPCLSGHSQQTSASGAFSFVGLAPGRYNIAVTPPSGFMLPPDQPNPRVVVLLAGAIDTVEVRLNFTPQDTTLTLYVGSQTVECMGFIQQKCLLVKLRQDDPYQFFYDSIEGFSFEAGFEYTIKVIRRRRPELSADQGLYTWQLSEILAKGKV